MNDTYQETRNGMKDFRVTVELDYEVPDDTDEDEFHDNLRDLMTDGYLQDVDQSIQLDNVRHIQVEKLK